MYSSEVITPQHLTRKAVIYIRQSTPHQALSHQESLRLQYALTEHAQALGWSPEAIEVVDTDLGLAFGLVVRSMGIAKSFGASFSAMRQGEVSQYTQLLEDSRRHAIDRMVENAKLLGGNAVIAMRFDSSEIGQQLTEIVAYGTAVVVRPSGT